MHLFPVSETVVELNALKTKNDGVKIILAKRK